MVHPDLVGLSIIGQSGLGTSGVLALSGGWGIRAPGFLPEAVSRLLFEMQVWYWVFGIGAGVVLFVAGQSRASRALVRAGITLVAAMLLWILLAFIFITPAERLYAAHQQIGTAAVEGNVDRVFSYLANDFECRALGVQNLADARSRISTELNRFHIKSNHVRAYKSQVSGSTGETAVTFLTESDAGVTKTSWILHWEDIPGSDWKITVAELKTINDSPVGDLQNLPF